MSDRLAKEAEDKNKAKLDQETAKKKEDDAKKADENKALLQKATAAKTEALRKLASAEANQAKAAEAIKLNVANSEKETADKLLENKEEGARKAKADEKLAEEMEKAAKEKVKADKKFADDLEKRKKTSQAKIDEKDARAKTHADLIKSKALEKINRSMVAHQTYVNDTRAAVSKKLAQKYTERILAPFMKHVDAYTPRGVTMKHIERIIKTHIPSVVDENAASNNKLKRQTEAKQVNVDEATMKVYDVLNQTMVKIAEDKSKEEKVELAKEEAILAAKTANDMATANATKTKDAKVKADREARAQRESEQAAIKAVRASQIKANLDAAVKATAADVAAAKKEVETTSEAATKAGGGK